MLAISIGLFFLPVINGLIAGFVGGYKLGSVRRALLAAALPALVLTAVVWIVFSGFGFALLGFFAGFAVGLVVLLADLGLFFGAILGGLIGNPYPSELPRAQVRS